MSITNRSSFVATPGQTIVGERNTIHGSAPGVSVVGSRNTIFCWGAEVTGDRNTVDGDRSVVTGERNIVNGSHCTVTGDRNVVNGNHCTVTGERNIVNGEGCSVTGERNSGAGAPEAARGGSGVIINGVPMGSSVSIVNGRTFVDGVEQRDGGVPGMGISRMIFGGRVGSTFTTTVTTSAAATRRHEETMTAVEHRRQAIEERRAAAERRRRLVHERLTAVEQRRAAAAAAKQAADATLDPDRDVVAADNEPACIVCFVNARAIIIKPCNHAQMCRGCVREIHERAERHHTPLQCPTCNGPITAAEVFYG